MSNIGNWYNDVMMQPWTRAGPYLVGICLGLILAQGRSTMRKVGLSKVNIILSYIILSVSLFPLTISHIFHYIILLNIFKNPHTYSTYLH